MRFVFKAAIAIIAGSAVGGQAWMHDPADRTLIASSQAISRECPAMAIEARAGQTSWADVVKQSDAYWRGRIVDQVAGYAGVAHNSCRSRRAKA